MLVRLDVEGQDVSQVQELEFKIGGVVGSLVAQEMGYKNISIQIHRTQSRAQSRPAVSLQVDKRTQNIEALSVAAL
jgi:hypothetical protein